MSTGWKDIWAIGISSDVPVDKHHKYLDQITLGDIKRTDLDLFVKRNSQAIRDNK